MLSALFNSIIIFRNAEYTLLLLDNKLIFEPGFYAIISELPVFIVVMM